MPFLSLTATPNLPVSDVLHMSPVLRPQTAIADIIHITYSQKNKNLKIDLYNKLNYEKTDES